MNSLYFEQKLGEDHFKTFVHFTSFEMPIVLQIDYDLRKDMWCMPRLMKLIDQSSPPHSICWQG